MGAPVASIPAEVGCNFVVFMTGILRCCSPAFSASTAPTAALAGEYPAGSRDWVGGGCSAEPGQHHGGDQGDAASPARRTAARRSRIFADREPFADAAAAVDYDTSSARAWRPISTKFALADLADWRRGFDFGSASN